MPLPEQQLHSSLADDPNAVVDPAILRKQLKDKEDYDSLFSYEKAIVPINQLIDDWKTECLETEKRQNLRKINIDVKKLRDEGKIQKSETFCVVRTIETNIQREKPAYLNYVFGSRRQAIFEPRQIKDVNKTQTLEKDYTDGLSYDGWQTPHEELLDGTQTHAWASMEVEFDEAKPLHVNIAYVGHDKLFFNRSCRNIQHQKRLVRVFDLTCEQLYEYVQKFGFNEEQVDKIIEANTELSKDQTFKVYRTYFKNKSVVYSAWHCREKGCNDWLKVPGKLFLGKRMQQMVAAPIQQPQVSTSGVSSLIQKLGGLFGGGQQQAPMQPQWIDLDEKTYPIVLLRYQASEEQKIFSSKGRVFLDESKQEAQTAILTGFVNSLIRASYFMATMKNGSMSGGAPKQLDVEIGNGVIISEPVDFFHMDYPDPSVLRALQYLDASNSNETGQLNYAVNNRQDSRKTAKEVETANQQSSLLSGVAVTQYSIFYRALHNIIWPIVQSQALQNKILLLQNEQSGVNDTQFIQQEFYVKAAGDVDVIQRAEKIQQMMQDWPVISTTPLAGRFLADMMRLKYPDNGELYAQMLEQQDPKQLLSIVSQILMGVLKDNPEVLVKLPPEEKQMLAQVEQQVKQVLGVSPAAGQEQQQAGGQADNAPVTEQQAA